MADIVAPAHPILTGVAGAWPPLLGYNKAALRDGADLVARVGDDPLIAAAHYGKGRGVAFASDCGPHWAPPPFVEWAGYSRLWNGIVGWAAGHIG